MMWERGTLTPCAGAGPSPRGLTALREERPPSMTDAKPAAVLGDGGMAPPDAADEAADLRDVAATARDDAADARDVVSAAPAANDQAASDRQHAASDRAA